MIQYKHPIQDQLIILHKIVAAGSHPHKKKFKSSQILLTSWSSEDSAQESGRCDLTLKDLMFFYIALDKQCTTYALV